MRTMACGNVVARLAVALIVGGAAFWLASAASAAPAGGNAARGGLSLADSSIEQVQYGSSYCARLRRACTRKHERGEVGEGNCARYRAECGSGSNYRGSRGYRPSDPYWRYRRGGWSN
jgi:hypothetical protein